MLRSSPSQARRSALALLFASLAMLGLAAFAPLAQAQPAPSAKPAVYSMDPAVLAAARVRLQADPADRELKPAYDKLIKDADKALTQRAASVMDKTKLADSGDIHDYFSLGPYWWPDPTKRDGLPYIRQDGKVNPESRTGTDTAAFSNTSNTIELLGLAYYFTGKSAYAEKAAQLARVWFLNPATRMNPNLQYAQAIPGITDGRGIGIIETRHIAALTDGLALISDSSAWTAEDQAAMRRWLEQFYTWLTTSKNGRDEAGERNNHGTWYAVQAAHLALVLGKNDDARQRIEKALTTYIAAQIGPDGSQPHELARTNSLGYSIFNLEALFALATLGDRVGLDGWTMIFPKGGLVGYDTGTLTTPGSSLHNALGFLAPYADPAKPWIKKDLKDGDRTGIIPLLREYLAHQNIPQFVALYQAHGQTPDLQDARWQLFLPAVR